MSIYDVILFDLDGTLTDPKVGITKSVQYALAKFNIIEEDLDQLTPFIGPPLAEMFKEKYFFDGERARQAISYYREYFSSGGLYENVVYPGIPQLLTKLCQNNKRLIVATSKPTLFSEAILKYFSLDSFFSLVVGSNLDGTRIAKTEVITYILDQLSGIDRSKVVMVGDRKHDIIGAKNTGIDSIAVAYGYGSLQELQAAKPDYLAATVEELGRIVNP
jgi:phosphoglycolate phosphatase